VAGAGAAGVCGLLGSIRSVIFRRRRRVVRGVDRRRAEGTVERHHVRPLPDADADDEDNDGRRNQTPDETAIRPARR